MKELGRRTFLKLAAATAIGVVVGEAKQNFVNETVNNYVSDATGHQTGNAARTTEINKECENSENVGECVKNFEYSTSEKIAFTVPYPIVEEAGFRTLPSYLYSLADHNRESPFEDVVFGTQDGIGISRRELIVEAVSSLLFGATHNFTEDGFDTNTIPASNITGGMIYWYLQRRFGVMSNLSAHSWHNFRVVNR